MGQNLARAPRMYPGTPAPFLLYVNSGTDAALVVFLAGLNGVGASDFATVNPGVSLWAAPMNDSSIDDGGTCFLVSAETYKRVQAFRY
jgi:hypothetical protein